MTGSDAPSAWGPRWSRWVGVALARGWWATEVRGREHLPRRGAAIVVANHVGFIDGPVLHGVVSRPSHFLIGSHMYRGALGPILRAAGQIRVEGAGRTALAQGLAVLRRGGVVGMFPEGTRGAGTADAVHGGAAWLALQSGAPIVPTALIGTRRAGEPVSVWPPPRRRILAAFGAPVTLAPPADLKGRRRQEWAQQAVAAALRAQVEATLADTDLRLPGDDGGRTIASIEENA
ncbi:lysophospholipid acyltransferase family protein [Demequina muriae]|uniref:Lysophospholipid acyltransferase family protein n=1 Tax=Demequina muriae TaxID=3051664 RepID=A0ABT8GK67_9MICO|nr:lysophospholipid acyltransferase family protein [Demequina sp. EGI L300058]MDN4481817.1 lysophospholipid acyltransferase family protein [Demequina sp. EGI L300058]